MTPAGEMSGVIAGQVLVRLAELDEWAAGVRRRSKEDVAEVREELAWLVRGWRALLRAHSPAQGSGRCPRCEHPWWRRAAWPCRVWRVAHERLVAIQGPAEPEPAPAPELPPGFEIIARDAETCPLPAPSPPTPARASGAHRARPLTRGNAR